MVSEIETERRNRMENIKTIGNLLKEKYPFTYNILWKSLKELGVSRSTLSSIEFDFSNIDCGILDNFFKSLHPKLNKIIKRKQNLKVIL